ncbi:hypothetical protein TUM4438_31100 [Shewanella sairae]|uniref:Uncharacterized protein n=1 Tax=Shewanella sairae TaxID=190310 RepID=A0ABQ4PMM8_9GAMM|nr:hypothetical protein [Shewanella sairae]MCL1131880.1 hypothetical protein [Shewanella sairae]GIU48833.1 hypothetical protein TUM4438_31100 [Shewanella sairae]
MNHKIIYTGILLLIAVLLIGCFGHLSSVNVALAESIKQLVELNQTTLLILQELKTNNIAQ